MRRDMSAPTVIEVQKSARLLRVAFDDGGEIRIDFDCLRNNSPAAGGKTEQSGVDLLSVELVGNYAIRPVFSDGHQNGIYTWDLLRTLAAAAPAAAAPPAACGGATA